MALTIEAFVLDNATIAQANEFSVAFNANKNHPTNLKTDDGVYQLWVDDQANMTKTDEVAIRIYEKAHNGGTSKLVFKATLKGVQSEVFVTPFLMLGNGWDMTLQMVTATSRAFDARISQMT